MPGAGGLAWWHHIEAHCLVRGRSQGDYFAAATARRGQLFSSAQVRTPAVELLDRKIAIDPVLRSRDNKPDFQRSDMQLSLT